MLKLSIDQQGHRHCDGISRRLALRVGAGGLISGLTLPRILELQAKAALPTPAKAKSCIFLFLEGGPPHQDMWEPQTRSAQRVPWPIQGYQYERSGNICDRSIATMRPDGRQVHDRSQSCAQ